MTDRDRPEPRGVGEPEGGDWSKYRWGILKALEDLAQAGKDRATESRLALEAVEKRLEDRICDAETTLTKAIAAVDALVRSHDRDVSVLKARAAMLGALAGAIAGAVLGAIAAKVV